MNTVRFRTVGVSAGAMGGVAMAVDGRVLSSTATRIGVVASFVRIRARRLLYRAFSISGLIRRWV